MLRIIILVMMAVLVSGCEILRGAKAKQASLAFSTDSGGGLSIWNAEMSAAVAYNSGQICMQRALAVKALDADTSLEISKAMLALSKATQVALTQGSGDEALVSVTASLKETAQLLTTSTERTTYLDLGMFYTCQISANGGLTDTQTAELIKVLMITGAAIGTDEVNEILNKANEQTITVGNNWATPNKQ